MSAGTFAARRRPACSSEPSAPCDAVVRAARSPAGAAPVRSPCRRRPTPRSPQANPNTQLRHGHNPRGRAGRRCWRASCLLRPRTGHAGDPGHPAAVRGQQSEQRPKVYPPTPAGRRRPSPGTPARPATSSWPTSGASRAATTSTTNAPPPYRPRRRELRPRTPTRTDGTDFSTRRRRATTRQLAARRDRDGSTPPLRRPLRRRPTSANITTLAGTSSGFSGDGGPATAPSSGPPGRWPLTRRAHLHRRHRQHRSPGRHPRR